MVIKFHIIKIFFNNVNSILDDKDIFADDNLILFIKYF